MSRFAETPVTIVRERGIPRECWVEDIHGHAVPLAITGFSLDGSAVVPGEATITLSACRVHIEDR